MKTEPGKKLVLELVGHADGTMHLRALLGVDQIAEVSGRPDIVLLVARSILESLRVDAPRFVGKSIDGVPPDVLERVP